MYYIVSKAAMLLGVHPTTIRRWHKKGKISCIRTLGGHRRIHRDEIKRIIEGKKRRYAKRIRAVATYSRVSSHEQKKKGDLNRQQLNLKKYCEDSNLKLEYELSDVGSGLNGKRAGLLKLFKLVTKGKISVVVINYRDRLTRFGFAYLESFLTSYGVTIKVVSDRETKSMEKEMVDDMIAIISSFSGKIHGMRSARNKNRNRKIVN